MLTSKIRQRVFITTMALALLIACLCPTLVADSGEQYVASELVLGMVEGYPVDSVNAEYGTIDVQLLPLLDIYLLNTGGGVDLDSLAEEMQGNPNVLFCHPNYVVDPMEPVQGSIPFGDINGEGEYAGQEAATQLDLPNAHIITTGQNVTVGVIDGGINYNHPAFSNTVQSGYDYVDDDTNADDEVGGENAGHGTFAAGVVHLVAPGADIRAYRVTDLDGRSDGYLVAEAILQAVQDGCKVINLSLVMMGEHQAIGSAVQYAKDNDVMVVVAAGNGQDDEPHYPANDPNTMAVAAVDSAFLLADFSSFGEWVDVCAPGTMIYSPYLDTSYAWWGGTSFSAPFVTGLAALMFSMDPEATWQDVHDAILASAVDIDYLNSGYDGQLGAGFIDPLASLLLLLGGSSLYHVPNDYPTIQEAVEAAYHGDTILVGPGTYYERIRIISKTLYLIGEEGAENTILQPSVDNSQILYAWGSFLPGGCVKGFTFLRGGSSGANAVKLDGASFLITENIFRECQPDSSTDKHVLQIENSASTVTRNLFVDNFGEACVGVHNGLTVINNTFDGNRVAMRANSWPVDRYVYNNIITNSSVYGVDAPNWNIFTEFDYNNLWNNAIDYKYSRIGGDNDFYTDPMYVDPQRGDYRLLPGSPSIDAGHPDPQYNDPDGSVNDVGAFFYEPILLPIARNLTIEPLEAGDIITSPTPSFSWEYLDTEASIQSQYHIQVTTDPTFISIDTWDSYPQSSSDTSVTYSGPALDDLTDFYFRVRLYTNGSWGDWIQSQFTSNFVTLINVPGDFSTIQEAVDMASIGDTILVGPGTYTESIAVVEKVLLLKSIDGPEVTIIEPVTTSAIALSFVSGGGSASTVDGFTVRDGVRNILGNQSAITVRNCILLNASDAAIMGYYSEGLTTIMDNRFEGNKSACDLTHSRGLIEDNLLINNVFNDVSDPSINVLYCDSTVVRGNIVVGTKREGIKVGYSSGAIVFGNTCYDNNGGIYLYYSPGCDLRNNLCAYNTELWGIQLRIGDSTDTFGYNNSYGNYPIDYVSYEPSATSLTQNPLFMDTAGYDFTPLPGSPCIDAGDPDPVFNDPDGTRSDIGAVPGAPTNWPVPRDLAVGPTSEAGQVVSLTPQISWSYQDTASTNQSEYHFQIGADEDWSTVETWDSGPVASADSSLAYSGPSLTNFTRYYLRLRVRNGADWGDWTLAPFAIKIGNVIHVPADQNTVQGAIDFTEDGDSVLVGPGTYTDRFNFQGKKIVVKSTDGPEVTIINGEPEGPIMVSFIGGEDSTSILDGFTIQNGSRQISVASNAAAKIVNNRLLNGEFGVLCHYNCFGLVIRGNYFEGNEAAMHLNDGVCFIEDNVIIGNGLGTNRSTVYLRNHNGSLIRGNIFSGNYVGDYEGALKIRSGGDNLILNNTFYGNYSIHPEDTLTYCILLQFEDAVDSVLNNIVAFNGDMTGIGQDSWSYDMHIIEYNDVYANGDGDYAYVSPGLGSMSMDPAFTDTANLDLSLTAASPCIDAGHPGIEYIDADGTTSDMGAIMFDGPFNLPLAQNIGVNEGDLTHVTVPTPTFHWIFFDSVGTSSGHEIEVGVDPDWTTAEMWAPGPVVATDTLVTYAGDALIPATNYYLRLRLYNGASWGDWRSTFFHRNAAPTMPLVIGPTSGDTSSSNGGLSITVSTDGDDDLLTYDFEVYSDAGLSQVVLSVNVSSPYDTINSGPLEGLSHELAYWWRARARDGYEVTPWTTAQQFHVTKPIILSNINGGSLASGTLDCGRTVEFRFRLTNDYQNNLRGLANGIRVYSPDQAAFDPIEAEWDYSAVDWYDVFDMLVYTNVYDGPEEDTALFGGTILMGDGLVPGASYPAWRIRVKVDCSEEGKTICLDSAAVSSTGQDSWIWAFGSGNNYVAPEWLGPYCFSIQRCCFGIRGDIDGDGNDADIGDLTYLVDYMFHNGLPPECLQEANFNGDPDEQIDISDLTYMVDYMFTGGPAPYDCDAVLAAPLAKAAIMPEVTLTTSYENDTTVIVCNSPVSLRGVQMTLCGTDDCRPLSKLSSGLELFHSQQDSTVTLGLLDIDGGETIRQGTNTLVSIQGRFELIDARVADLSHRTIYPLTKSGEREVELPKTFSLSQNYPNPFNPATRIDYALPIATDVRIDIFNILGQKVRTLKNTRMPAGWHSVTWNGNSGSGDPVSSGVYFYRIRTDQQTVTKKMLLLK